MVISKTGEKVIADRTLTLQYIYNVFYWYDKKKWLWWCARCWCSPKVYQHCKFVSGCFHVFGKENWLLGRLPTTFMLCLGFGSFDANWVQVFRYVIILGGFSGSIMHEIDGQQSNSPHRGTFTTGSKGYHVLSSGQISIRRSKPSISSRKIWKGSRMGRNFRRRDKKGAHGLQSHVRFLLALLPFVTRWNLSQCMLPAIPLVYESGRE